MKWWAWAAIGIGALVIRSHALASRSYWLDEILDVFALRQSWTAMWRGLQAGLYNAPLDYLIRKCFETWEPSEGVRRLIGVVWGTASVVLFGLLIARRSNRRAGLIAAALLAVSPYHVRYSQEVRPYAFALFLICLDLWILDHCLERPSVSWRIAFLLTSVAAAYTSYLAALIILIAAGGILLSDGAGPPARSENVRKFFRSAPILLVAFAIAYLPWWPVLVTAFRAPGLSEPPPIRWARAARIASFFGFGETDWQPFGPADAVSLGLVVIGAVLAVRNARLRFLVGWGFGGILVMEILEQRHPVYDSVFHEMPAAMALTGLAAISLAWTWGKARIPGAILLAAVLVLDLRGVARYFAHGRPDWRPLAAYLRGTPHDEPILAGSSYTQLCLGFYVNGPDWFSHLGPASRSVTVAEAGEGSSGWDRRTNAWLVESGGRDPAVWPNWSRGFPTLLFPDAEGENGVGVRHLLAPPPPR